MKQSTTEGQLAQTDSALDTAACPWCDASTVVAGAVAAISLSYLAPAGLE